MSLTSFLKKPDPKTLFSYYVKDPQHKLEGKLRAPSLSKNYSLVGTAFDYLFRFCLQYRFPKAITERWVAETACDFMGFMMSPVLGGDLEDVINYEESLSEEDFSHYLTYMEAKKELEIAKMNHQRYLLDGILRDDLLRSVLVLAQLDFIFREIRFPKNFGEVDTQDIQDLRNLINIVDFSKFQPRDTCILNPTFHEASRLVGGADADLVIDERLIDIKTVKDLLVKKEWIHQLVGYYVLGKIGGIGPERVEGEKIKNVGIYFSRYGILELFNINELIDPDKLPNLIGMLKIMAKTENQRTASKFGNSKDKN